jgi:hypothetical protein
LPVEVILPLLDRLALEHGRVVLTGGSWLLGQLLDFGISRGERREVPVYHVMVITIEEGSHLGLAGGAGSSPSSFVWTWPVAFFTTPPTWA